MLFGFRCQCGREDSAGNFWGLLAAVMTAWAVGMRQWPFDFHHLQLIELIDFEIMETR